jgi:hypothetical protein
MNTCLILHFSSGKRVFKKVNKKIQLIKLINVSSPSKSLRDQIRSFEVHS